MPKTTETSKRKTRKAPKAATLYTYLNDYLNTNQIGEDQSIGVVMAQLRETIVDEAIAK